MLVVIVMDHYPLPTEFWPGLLVDNAWKAQILALSKELRQYFMSPFYIHMESCVYIVHSDILFLQVGHFCKIYLHFAVMFGWKLSMVQLSKYP